MPLSTGKTYLEQFADDPVAQRALLACAAALRLDDESASAAIEVVAQANGRTRELLHTVKDLGCVWRQWDGSWYLAEDVRKELVGELHQRVPSEQVNKLRSQLADKADQRAAAMPPDGQITTHQLRIALIEAGYQRTMVPGQVEKGGEQLGAIWEKAAPAAGEATARSVDYLAPEIEEHIGQLPVQVLFLRGMAARARHDRADQEKYFRAVWEQGRPGQIFGAAAHFFGLLVRDRRVAEQALRDSVQWNEDPRHRAEAYHSLGNLLAKDRRRWPEAEDAYRASLNLLHDAPSQGQVWHSLGNLLAKDRRRWPEAEDAHRESLRLLHDAPSQAQVWHSLGNLLAKDLRRWREAEGAYQRSLGLDPGDVSAAQVWHSLGNLLAKDRRRWPEAEDAYRESLRLRHDAPHQAQVWHSLGNFFTKDERRWEDAENAFNKSKELCRDREHEAHVGASLANLLTKYQKPEADVRAEQLALRSLELDRGNPWTGSVCHRILAAIYERQGNAERAIRELEGLLEADRRQGKSRFQQAITARIAALSRGELPPLRKLKAVPLPSPDEEDDEFAGEAEPLAADLPTSLEPAGLLPSAPEPAQKPIRSHSPHEQRVQEGIERVLKEAWESVPDETPPENRFKVARAHASDIAGRLSPHIKREVRKHFETQKWEQLKHCDPKSTPLTPQQQNESQTEGG